MSSCQLNFKNYLEALQFKTKSIDQEHRPPIKHFASFKTNLFQNQRSMLRGFWQLLLLMVQTSAQQDLLLILYCYNTLAFYKTIIPNIFKAISIKRYACNFKSNLKSLKKNCSSFVFQSGLNAIKTLCSVYFKIKNLSLDMLDLDMLKKKYFCF